METPSWEGVKETKMCTLAKLLVKLQALEGQLQADPYPTSAASRAKAADLEALRSTLVSLVDRHVVSPRVARLPPRDVWQKYKQLAGMSSWATPA